MGVLCVVQYLDSPPLPLLHFLSLLVDSPLGSSVSDHTEAEGSESSMHAFVTLSSALTPYFTLSVTLDDMCILLVATRNNKVCIHNPPEIIK